MSFSIGSSGVFSYPSDPLKGFRQLVIIGLIGDKWFRLSLLVFAFVKYGKWEFKMSGSTFAVTLYLSMCRVSG